MDVNWRLTEREEFKKIDRKEMCSRCVIAITNRKAKYDAVAEGAATWTSRIAVTIQGLAEKMKLTTGGSPAPPTTISWDCVPNDSCHAVTV